jgi:hypothetical protein
MHRVLKPGGRVGIMTWGAIEHCPSQLTMYEMWTRRFGREQGVLFENIHALSDPVEVQTLLDTAGFREVSVATAMGMARFASPEMLTRAYGTSLGIETDVATQKQIIAEIDATLSPYVGADGLACPLEAVFARGVRIDGE